MASYNKSSIAVCERLYRVANENITKTAWKIFKLHPSYTLTSQKGGKTPSPSYNAIVGRRAFARRYKVSKM